MQNEKISLTRVLAKLKIIDSRIDKAMHNLNVVVAYSKKTPLADDFMSKGKSGYESVLGLIAEKTKLKRALHLANSTTIVKGLVIYGNDKPTIAEVIEFKNTIEYYTELYSKLLKQKGVATTKVEKKADELERQATEQISIQLGNETNKKGEVEALIELQTTMFQLHIQEAIPIDATLDKLGTIIDKFTDDVDVCLSETNTTTMVEV